MRIAKLQWESIYRMAVCLAILVALSVPLIGSVVSFAPTSPSISGNLQQTDGVEDVHDDYRVTHQREH